MLLHPAVKLGIALAILFVSFMCFAQSGRLYSHVVSILRAITASALGLAEIRVVSPPDPPLSFMAPLAFCVAEQRQGLC